MSYERYEGCRSYKGSDPVLGFLWVLIFLVVVGTGVVVGLAMAGVV